MSETVQPLFNQVLIEPDEKVDKTGISLPKSMREKPMRGQVVSVGRKVEDLKVGDAVYFRRYAGDPVEVELGRELLLIAEDDCLGRILDSNQPKTEDKNNQDNLAEARP